ncbi:RICIN domain-containing protein [Pseudoramibacter sp.]|uniref:RICIN domain-containing protein n=1 Tax=Pseudoramibacter sp. TaxID=2034862 RepID=UPI0025F1B1FE|nr:RICIN domain-containing protein [Pseudoramibacter sp.]MCH4071973.1 RICIN domain-containing protein [Pseudoramibacter sp.]
MAAALAVMPAVSAAPAAADGANANTQEVTQTTTQTQEDTSQSQNNTAEQNTASDSSQQTTQPQQSTDADQAESDKTENQKPAIDTSQYYEIQSAVGHSKVLDIYGGSVGNNVNAQIYAANGTQAQRFRFVQNSDGTYTIYTAVGCRALDVVGAGSANGTNVQQYDPNNTSAQHWTVTSNDDGTVTFSPSCAADKALDVFGGSSQSGANVQIYGKNGTNAQKWTLASAGKIPDFSASSIMLCPSYTPNTVVDVSGGSDRDGANIQCYQYNETAAQKFNIIQNSDGSYTIKNARDGKVLDVAGGSHQSGTNVWQYTPNGTDAQKWIITQRNRGLRIKNRGSGLMLDVAGASWASGANVQVYTNNDTSAQRWTVAKSDRAVTAGDNLGDSFTAMVKNVNGKALAVSNRNVAMWVPNYTKNRAWVFTRNVDHSYTLSPLSNLGCALDIAGGADADGINVQIYAKNGSAAQKFVIQKQSSGAYTLMPENSATRVLDVYGNSSEENTNVDLYTANGTNAQLFKIEKVDQRQFNWTERKLVANIAESQLGTHEGTNNYTKYGVWYAGLVHNKSFEHGAWCAMFASWCGAQAGVPSSIYYYHAYTPYGVQWYQSHNCWQWKNYTPRTGDLVYYDWQRDGVVDHVGVVVNSQNGMITTVEGNYKDAVNSRYISSKADAIFGYGVPRY